MRHLFDERRSVLIQDIRDLSSVVFPKLVSLHNELSRRNGIDVSISELFFWIMCELTVAQFAYQVRHHNSKDSHYRHAYDMLRNEWNLVPFSIEKLFEFYVKGPALYVPSHDVQVSLNQTGSDLIYTFFWNEVEYNNMRQRLPK